MIEISDRLKLLMTGIICVVLASGISTAAAAATFELEVCDFKGNIIDRQGKTAPPGLDEKLNCDHRCFYDELGINLINEYPTLQDMYSIGWRIIEIVEHRVDYIPLWTVYMERKKGLISKLFPNDCEKIYSG